MLPHLRLAQPQHPPLALRLIRTAAGVGAPGRARAQLVGRRRAAPPLRRRADGGAPGVEVACREQKVALRLVFADCSSALVPVLQVLRVPRSYFLVICWALIFYLFGYLCRLSFG